MKRSEINEVIKQFEALLKEYKFSIPQFCNWSKEEWEEKNEEYDEIRDNQLGWDITDFGMNKFNEVGFSLITLRNGNQKDDRYEKPYAEKLLMLFENQKAPMHYHAYKCEDIINRGGGTLIISVYNANKVDASLSDSDVTINTDGRSYSAKAGTKVYLKPGESITIWPYQYHDFAVEGGAVLIGEVSMCNDDVNDNFFYEPIGRFPKIVEDEKPYRLLCNEYPRYKK
ncbi:MAG: D-lyxose/D-mannose family sugar isomerase [Pleomorphochaeta sp.]